MTSDVFGVVTQIIGIIVTVLSATWWLSTRLENLKVSLETHTVVVQAEIKMLEREIGELKTAFRETGMEIKNLRERTVRLETKEETHHGKFA